MCDFEYNYRNYSTENGLPSSETYDVEQDNEGNIWIGTDRGAVKYDGQKFVTYTKKEGLLDDVILNIYKDPFGRIWFVTMLNELCYYEDGKIHHFRFNHLIRKHLKNVYDVEKNMLVLENKTVLLSVNNYGTYSIDSKGSFRQVFQPNATIQVTTYGKNELWSAKYNGWNKNRMPRLKILYCKDKKCDLIALTLQGNPRKKLTKSQNNSYFLTDNVIYNLTERKKLAIDKKSQILHINSIGHDLWIGQLGKGLQIYKFENGNPILRKTLLANYSVSNSFRDSKGGYWFSTLEAGVFYIPYFEIQGLNHKKGLLSDELRSVFGLNKDLYLGYNNLGIQKITDSKIYTIYTDYQLCTFSCVDNKLLISSGNQGVYLEGEKVSGNWARDLYPIKNKCLSICRSGYEINAEGKEIQLFDAINNNAKVFFAVMEDHKGTIWLGDRNGIHFLKEGKVIAFCPKEFNHKITDLIEHNTWGKVVATRDAGIFLWKGNQFLRVNNLLSEDITTLFVDPQNRLWVGTKKGVNILWKGENGEIGLDCLTKKQGLYSDEITSVFVDKNKAWIGTNKGLSIVNLSYLSRIKNGYKVILKSIIVDDKSINLKHDIKIPYSEDVVQINFGATDFVTKGMYKYRLGKTSKWTYVTKPQIILLNPEDGEYQLEASFLDENNSWSPIHDILNFEITPPFWRTNYFFFLILLTIGYLVFLFVRYKKRQFETKQKVLILEQKALFAQMNPHFIFNTLNSIQSFLIYNENDKAEYFLSKFSKLLRQTLHISRNSSISTEKEIDLLEKYLSSLYFHLLIQR